MFGSLDALNKEHFETYYDIKKMYDAIKEIYNARTERAKKLQYTVEMHDLW